jgi:hypothetical protein
MDKGASMGGCNRGRGGGWKPWVWGWLGVERFSPQRTPRAPRGQGFYNRGREWSEGDWIARR